MATTHRKDKRSERVEGDASSAGQSDTDAETAHTHYKAQLHLLRIELVKLQGHFIRCEDSILVLLEGRDASGTDGSIKRILKNLSPRDTRVVALGKPSDRELRAWYFERYVAQLPVAEELVLFNRSWYNRAGIEHVKAKLVQPDPPSHSSSRLGASSRRDSA